MFMFSLLLPLLVLLLVCVLLPELLCRMSCPCLVGIQILPGGLFVCPGSRDGRLPVLGSLYAAFFLPFLLPCAELFVLSRWCRRLFVGCCVVRVASDGQRQADPCCRTLDGRLLLTMRVVVLLLPRCLYLVVTPISALGWLQRPATVVNRQGP